MNTKDSYASAMAAFERKNYVRAAELFSASINSNDLCGMLARYYASEAHLREGLRKMSAGAYDAAASAFHSASQLNPSHQRLPQYLACCFSQTSQYDLASRYSDREVELQPDSASAHIRSALAVWKAGQPTQAIQRLHDALHLIPNSAELHFQLGVLYGALRDLEHAIESLMRAVELEPQHSHARMQLGMVYASAGQYDNAYAALVAAQRLAPFNAEICLYLAMASKATQRPANADMVIAQPAQHPSVQLEDIETLSALISTEPDIVEAFVVFPDKSHQDLFELLGAVIDHALLENPHRAELHYYRARVYRRSGLPNQAIASCERAVEIDPQMVQALITLAKLYRETSRDEDAEARLSQVLRMGFEYADVHYLLGCIYRDRGSQQQARQSYERALRINRHYEAARIALQQLAA